MFPIMRLTETGKAATLEVKASARSGEENRLAKKIH